MKNILKAGFKKNILPIFIILILNINLSGCSFTSEDKALKTNDISTKLVSFNEQEANFPSSDKNGSLIENENEETVVISVNNFGRANPFKPYNLKSIVIGEQASVSNLPQPPAFSPDPSLSTLLDIKVSGILYEPNKPSAIINVSNNDYLVHKGDSIFDFYVQNITADKVTIKKNNNVYKAGIGEIIEGIINTDPVNNPNISLTNSNNTKSTIRNIQELPSLN